jgi:hypothetical protein
VLRAKLLPFTVAAALFTFAPLVAYGQGGTTGSIVGNIFDQTGSPIKGVKVVASSPTQIGGARTAYTNDQGEFRMRQLFPGKFEVRAMAPKLKTVVQKDVNVGITSSAEVNIVMEVEVAGVEEVKVVEKAPTVSTTTTNVKEVYDLDFVEAMPFNSRDQVFNQMVAQIGGAVGNRIRGGAANQTLFTQDGFDMRDQYPVTKASAAYEIQSAGYGADNPTASGGLVNLVTKTGSNKFEFEFNATAEPPQVYFGDARDNRHGNYYYVINPAFAGPIIKDKLWYAFAFENHWLGRGREEDPTGITAAPLPYKKGINKGTLKITWQMNSRNKLSFLNNVDSAWETNLRDGFGIDREAQEDRRAGLSGLWGLIWESLLTDNLVLRVQAAYSRRPQHWYPASCGTDPAGCDFTPAVVNNLPAHIETGNDPNHQRWDLDVYQAATSLQWFVDTKHLGEHSFVLKDNFYTEQETRYYSKPTGPTGDGLYEWNATDRSALTRYWSNDPRYEPGRFGWWVGSDTLFRNVATLSDAWRPTRHLTITPAVSHVWAAGNNGTGDNVVNNNTFAPSLAVAWDATHDGRTVVRGSASQYVDVAIRTALLHNLGSQAQQRCQWNTDTQQYDKSCVFSGGLSPNTYGHPCGPSGIDANGNSCVSKLGIPRTYEVTFGGEREIVEGVGLSMDLVYRKYASQYEANETNRIWNATGDVVVGYKNGRAATIMDMSTPSAAQRSYAGLTAALNKRAGRTKVYLSYTLSRLRGTVWDPTVNNPWGDIPGRDAYLNGPGGDDHTHDIKASLQYSAFKWLSFGARWNYSSGFPYNRLFRNETTGNWENYRAQTGINPGANVNDPGDDRALRTPDRQEINLQVRLSLLSLIGSKLDFYVDALNILGLRTPLTYSQNEGQNFGVEATWMAPFRLRFGVNYVF